MMSNLSPRQFGTQNSQPTKHKVTPPRTMGGDLIDARGRVRSAGAETPPWLLSSKGKYRGE